MPAPSRPPGARRIAGRLPVVTRSALVVALLVGTNACDGSDNTAGGTDVAAWCAQLDVAVTTSAALDEIGTDDPGLDDALADVQEEMDALADLAPPEAIAADWDAVSTPPTTNDTDAYDLTGDVAAAGDRIAAWALRECDLSNVARAALDRPPGS